MAKRFQRYGPAEGLPHDVILSLGEAPDGSLLAGYRGGLYQQKGHRFEKVPLPGARGIDSYSAIRCDGEGRTYIATERGLLVATKAQHGSGLVLRLARHARQLQVDWALTEFSWSRGRLWYGCGTGLCRMTAAGVTVFGKAAGLARGNLDEHPPGWQAAILWVHDPHKFAVCGAEVRASMPRTRGFPQTAGGCQMEVDGRGRLLVPTIEGLTINEGRHFRTVGSREGLRGPVVFRAARPRGFDLAGLGRPRISKMERLRRVGGVHFRKRFGERTDLPDSASGEWHGARRYRGRPVHRAEERERWVWQRDSRVGRMPIHALQLEPDGSLWLGTERNGAARIDPRTGRIEWFKQDRGLEVLMALRPGSRPVAPRLGRHG